MTVVLRYMPRMEPEVPVSLRPVVAGRGAKVAPSRLAADRLFAATPIGDVDAAIWDYIIVILNWMIRNDGTMVETVGPRIAVTERQFAREITQAEGWMDFVTHEGVVQPGPDIRAPVDNTNPRRRLLFTGQVVDISPGAQANVGGALTIGLELILGMTDLDVDTGIDRIPQQQKNVIAFENPNLFSVPQVTALAAVGEPDVSLMLF